MPIQRLSAGSRLPLASLVGLALLLKLLVPSGWMPHVEGGTLTLVPCSGSGPLAPPSAPKVPAAQADHAQHGTHGAHAQQAMHAIHGGGHHAEAAPAPAAPSGGSHHGGKEGQAADQPCAFAAASVHWIGGDAAMPPPPPLPGFVLPVLPPAVSVGRGLAAPPPPSTGPPHLS